MNTLEQNVPKGDWKDDAYVEASANHFKGVKAIKECIFNALVGLIVIAIFTLVYIICEIFKLCKKLDTYYSNNK